METLVNPVTANLAPYPMEELTKIRKQLLAEGKEVFDFGTGDPKIATEDFIKDKLRAGVPEISQYPSILGSDELKEAHRGYLQRRLGISDFSNIELVPTRGSKEGIFHLTLSLIGRSNKMTIVYPDPGYPVYRSATLFAQGKPHPVGLKEDNAYRLEPWNLPSEIQKDTAAVWVNYPHNPTGATVDEEYYRQLIDWAHDNDSLILSDDCYVDIYDEAKTNPPPCPLTLNTERVLCFFSLSKRSGLTGYRCGFIAGDARFLKPHLRARANMGLGLPIFIQDAAAAAWSDDEHVAKRRKIFFARMNLAGASLKELGMIDQIPVATFYLWSKIPSRLNISDVDFCRGLAERNVIASPSSWLGSTCSGYVRFAMVPENKDIERAMSIVSSYVKSLEK